MMIDYWLIISLKNLFVNNEVWNVKEVWNVNVNDSWNIHMYTIQFCFLDLVTIKY